MAREEDGARRLDQAGLIREIARFLREVKAEKGILFGSRAKGEEISSSDVDLVVLADHFAAVPFHRRLVYLQEHWRLPHFLEALPYTAEEFQRLSHTRGVVRAALEDGVEILPGP
ncbi:MAG TPA: nucleotidyltransferase domain-containing protein [Firmicutes bacterium]|nr:nucleotidyltransferase domain-containing protein [Bacillota bacterium]